MSKPWFWLALSEEACPTSTASSVGCNGQETQICGSSWCREDSRGFQKWWAQKKHALGLRRGNVLFKKISLQKVWRHTPNCRCHVDSIPKFPPKTDSRRDPVASRLPMDLPLVANSRPIWPELEGKEGFIHLFCEVYIRGTFILNPDCWWWRKSSSSSDGLETRLGVRKKIILFAWHLDIHRWWFLSDFGGSIVFGEHEEMEQTDAIELGAHRGYGSWVWRLWRNLTPSWSPKTRQNISQPKKGLPKKNLKSPMFFLFFCCFAFLCHRQGL